MGIYNNDIYNPNSPEPAYLNPYPMSGSNFDNGTTPHPDPIYGDIVQQDPRFVNITKRFPDCDAQLGGVGTQANMFEVVMFNRWTGMAPLYTPYQVVECLRAGWRPGNPALFKASSTGGFVGAMPPGSVKHRVTQ